MRFDQGRSYAAGKFARNKGSYLFSARRGMLDLALKLLGKEDIFPKSYDAMSKVEFALSDKHILSWQTLRSGDRYSFGSSQ